MSGDRILDDLSADSSQTSGDRILDDLSSPESSGTTASGRVGFGLIKGKPHTEAEAADIKAKAEGVESTAYKPPEPWWKQDVRLLERPSGGGIIGYGARSAAELASGSASTLGSVVSDLGTMVSELGAPDQFNSPTAVKAGNAINTAGNWITPQYWAPPQTAAGRLPSAAFDLLNRGIVQPAAKGYGLMAELAGGPRAGAVTRTVMSHLPSIVAAEETARAIPKTRFGREVAPLPGPAGEQPALTGAQPANWSNAGIRNWRNPVEQAPARQVTGGGSAVANFDPYPQMSNEIYPKQGDQFSLLKPSMVAGDLPPADQAVRAKILRDAGITDAIRDSSITGNPQTLWNEVTLQNTPGNPEGAIIKNRMAIEQAKIRDLGDKLVERTGANMHIDPEASGELVTSPLWEGKELTRKNASAMYTEAYSRVGDNPLTTSDVGTMLKAPSFRNELLSKNADTLRAIDNMYGTFEKEGFGPEAPAGTIRAAEQFRQFLTKIRTFQNSHAIDSLQEAIDHDVGAAGGSDLLSNARANWKIYKENFSDPNGISSLLTDPKDINRQVPYERVTQKFLNMPNAQAAHIWTQLDNIKNIPGVTPAIVQAAEQAKAELRGAAVRQITQAAGKTASVNGVAANRAANALVPKLQIVLSDNPELLSNLHTFNKASQLIPDNTAYRGAEVQKRTLARLTGRAIPAAAGAVGTGVGMLTGHPFAGAAVGAELGNIATSQMEDAFSANRAKSAALRYQSNARIGM